jgi:hypothetical protein
MKVGKTHMDEKNQSTNPLMIYISELLGKLQVVIPDEKKKQIEDFVEHIDTLNIVNKTNDITQSQEILLQSLIEKARKAQEDTNKE